MPGKKLIFIICMSTFTVTAVSCSSTENVKIKKETENSAVIAARGQTKADAIESAKEKAEGLFGSYKIKKSHCEKKFESFVRETREDTYTGMLNAYWKCEVHVEESSGK